LKYLSTDIKGKKERLSHFHQGEKKVLETRHHGGEDETGKKRSPKFPRPSSPMMSSSALHVEEVTNLGRGAGDNSHPVADPSEFVYF